MSLYADAITEDVERYLDDNPRRNFFSFLRFALFFLSNPTENKFRDGLVGILAGWYLISVLFTTIKYGVM